ncbi:transmembrane protease serine 9-like [Paramisgurnus dabryanus]|uniref:transmembrane protease serine 9-like n=1 Tax=Paramisgurnus dabryanus TaxID=90735 RepID=UPI0031F449F5
MFHYLFLLCCVSFVGGMESGIIGGKEAKPHSRPYMASLQLNGHHHTCGGMLIREDFVLTSAHCLNRSDYSGRNHLEVVLGAHNFSQKEKSQQRIQVKKYIRHPLFEQQINMVDYSYDIMLLKLKKKAKLNKFVKVIPLPKENGKTPAHEKCSIAGWGKKKQKEIKPSSVLHEVSLKLESSSECKIKWQESFSKERNICTVPDGKRAFCQGDSGSPLVCESELLGIAAYTYPNDCTNTDYPEVFVKIPAFLTWIKKKMKILAGMESGIIGGKEAKPHSRPYMASLQRNGHHTCGGMLIKEDFVLTAAHCLNRSDYSGQNHLEVVLGAHNINQKEKSQQRIQVKQYHRHNLFEQNNVKDYSYDIMLLKLKMKAKLNKFVKVMSLPKKNGKTPARVKCTIAGWGMKNKNETKASSVLREVSLKLQFSIECKHKWQYWFDSERNICSVSNGKEAFCKGDSGGPLFCNSKPVGLASFSEENCTNRTYPEVYVKIAHFLPWIKKWIA